MTPPFNRQVALRKNCRPRELDAPDTRKWFFGGRIASGNSMLTITGIDDYDLCMRIPDSTQRIAVEHINLFPVTLKAIGRKGPRYLPLFVGQSSKTGDIFWAIREWA